MRTRNLIGVVAAGLLSLAAPPIAEAQLRTPDADQRYVPGEAIVRFEPGVGPADRRAARSGADVSFDESLRLPRTQVVEFDGSVRAAIERLEGQPGVAYAQPNYRYHATAAAPNDTRFADARSWGLKALPGVDVLPAWDRSRGGGQIIAVLDTGVDVTHPDLAGNLWSGPGGIHGHDFVDSDANPDDEQYHGTHVAGTAAAVAGNSLGVAGVAPEADIMAVRVLDGDGGGSTADIANGVLFASANGARVINMSLGGPPDAGDTAMSNAAATAEQRGSLIVAAAGNNARNNDTTAFSPCTLPNPNIVCVAAVENTGGLANYSNIGPSSVDVGAPGGDDDAGEQEILSTKPAWVTEFHEGFDNITDWSGAWGIEDRASPLGDGNWAADSPEAQYANNADVTLEKKSPVNMSGQGCRMGFDFEIDTADDGDVMRVAVDDGLGLLGFEFTGFDGGRVEATVPEIDGQSVIPFLEFISDESGQGTGGFVDDFRLACRGNAPADYDDDVVDADLFDLSAGAADSGGGSYMAISGTSMAAPHVSGVAALVLAADPGASAAQVVQAIKNGARPLSSLAGKTVTGGAVNATGAIDASLGIANSQSIPPPPPPSNVGAGPQPPGPVRFGKVSASRRGVIRMVLRGDRNTNGVVTLRANITRPRAARLMRVARKSFRIDGTGRTTVKVRLSRPARRQLLRNRRLALRARVVLRNGFDLASTTTARLRVRLRRR